MKIISQNSKGLFDKRSEIVEKEVSFKCFDSCTLSSNKLKNKLGPTVGWTYAICFIDDEGNKTEGRITNENKKYYEVNEDLLDKLEIDSTEVYSRIDEECSRDEQEYYTESNSPEFVKLLEEYFPMDKK